MNILNFRSNHFALMAPLSWGLLSYLVFSVLKTTLPTNLYFSRPIWLWLWLLQMILVIPFWYWMSTQDFEKEQKNTLCIFGKRIPLGKPVHYLVIAYIAGITAVPFADRWYGQWLVFGGIVSPIFEELFSRNFLTPWLKRSWIAYFAISCISCVAFSLMHWGFNNMEAFALSPHLQLLKFVSHFTFAFALCIIFRMTKCIQLLILIHIASNLQFILPKL